MGYFGLCVFASLSGFAIGTAPHLWFSLCCLDRTLESTVTACFPLSFALGGLLTPLYYGLDHSNPEKQRRNQADVARGYAYVEIADHLEHGLALPLVLFHACFVGTPPDSFTTAALVSVYAASYLALTLLNHQLTGLWTYPVIDEIEKGSGWAGVLGFFSVVVGLMVGLAFAGSALATAF